MNGEFVRELVEVAMTIRASSPETYARLVKALTEMRQFYRDRAIDGAVDNGLTIGFARGVSKVAEIIADAPALHEKSQRVP